jgi:hypothetical protein
LDNTLVFFNSCASYPNNSTALADAIRGNTSMFLGWNAPVSLPDSNLASKTFYEWLSLSGVTVGEAYNRLGELQTDSKGSRLINSTRAAGGDLRIRDIVTLLHPDIETRLDPSMEVGILGQLGDGAPDAVPYLVQVDGILPDNADDALVHVSVDGVEAEQLQPFSSGVGGFPDSWFLSGEVALTDDLQQEVGVDQIDDLSVRVRYCISEAGLPHAPHRILTFCDVLQLKGTEKDAARKPQVISKCRQTKLASMINTSGCRAWRR